MVTRSQNYEQLLTAVRQYNPVTGDWMRDSTHILLRFLRDLYFQHDPQDFHWEPSQEATEVEIRATRTVDISTLERRPAILVHRNQFRYGVTSVDLKRDLDMTTGNYTEMDLVAGSYTIHCLSPEGLEAERLALITARGLRHFRQNLKLAGFFQVGRSITIGEEQDAYKVIQDQAKNQYVDVPVAFPVYYQEGVTITRPTSGQTLADEIDITLRGRGTKIDDKNRELPYYPAQVDGQGNPSGPNIVVQQSQLDNS